MNELAIFSYEQKEVRTITDEHGEPWFVAKDVCEVLEIGTEQIRRLDDDEKGLRKAQTLKGMQDLSVISESGLYTLIIRSNKPQAKPFRKWVTAEVLPSIRKTGSYAAPAQQQLRPVKTANGLLEVDKAFRAALRMAKAIGLDSNAAIISANQLARKITGSDPLQLLEVKGIERPVEDHPLTPTEIGKFIGNISGQEVNKQLVLGGLQEKIGKVYVPTAKGSEFAVLIDTGKQHSDGAPISQLKWKRRIVDQLKQVILNQIEPEAVTEN